MKTELESIRDLVRACGLFIKDADRGHLHVDAKSGRTDLVTQYDKQVQERLRQGLLRRASSRLRPPLLGPGT